MKVLDKKILQFDITKVTGYDINQHINYYLEGVNEAYYHLNNGNSDTALKILKELIDQLKIEYNHFKLKRFRDYSSYKFEPYADSVIRAYSKCSGRTTYNSMNSKLYDLCSYIESSLNRYNNNSIYGNLYADNVLNQLNSLDNVNYHSQNGKFLQTLYSFYKRPGKGTAQEILKLSRSINIDNYDNYVDEDYINRFLH